MPRRIVCLSFVLIALLSNAWAEDRRPDKSVLKIMTYNVKFMWDGQEPEEGEVKFPWKGKPALAEARIKQIAKAIKQYNPDIINLVEVEGEPALRLLNDKYLADQGYKVYFVQGCDTHTGQDLGLLTRIDPKGKRIQYSNKKGASGRTRKGVSKNYCAEIYVGNMKLGIVGVHFISGPRDPKRKIPRQAQADAIRLMALPLRKKGYSIIVLGDFNDFDGATLDHVGNRPKTEVLAILKKMDPSTGSDDLINAAKKVKRERRYTSHWDKDKNGKAEFPWEYSSIDHILVSPELMKRVIKFEIPHERGLSRISDHFPVIVSLETTE